jgi:integrase
MPPPQNPSDRATSLNIERNKFKARARLSLVTQQGYAHDWVQFERWCFQEGLASMPAAPDTVALYITDQLVTGKKIATARRRWSAILGKHRAAGAPLANVEEVNQILSGAQRIRLETPDQMAPLTLAQLEQVARSLEGSKSPHAVRNWAIVVFGFASALRRSSLAALLLTDIEFTLDGIIVHLRKEKQDQWGRGRMIGVPCGQKPLTCPVAAVRAWLKCRPGGESPGPLFTRLAHTSKNGDRLRAPAFGEIVKTCVSRIGLDPDKYAGHSLRSGFITAAGEGGASTLLIASQSGHRSLAMVQRYFRRTELFKANAAKVIGL